MRSRVGTGAVQGPASWAGCRPLRCAGCGAPPSSGCASASRPAGFMDGLDNPVIRAPTPTHPPPPLPHCNSCFLFVSNRLVFCLLGLQTTGFTGADLANLVNEAALLAGRSNKGGTRAGSVRTWRCCIKRPAPGPCPRQLDGLRQSNCWCLTGRQPPGCALHRLGSIHHVPPACLPCRHRHQRRLRQRHPTSGGRDREEAQRAAGGVVAALGAACSARREHPRTRRSVACVSVHPTAQMRVGFCLSLLVPTTPQQHSKSQLHPPCRAWRRAWWLGTR